MSRNRMRNSQSLHWMGVLKWVLILGLVSILGLSYMFCKNQNMRLAADTKQLRVKLERIEQHNTTLALDLEMLKSPMQLKRRLAQMHSTLLPLYDPQMIAHVRRMEGESTRMMLAKMGTIPNVDLSAHPVGANEAQDDPSPTANSLESP
jgi:hypothetical protein